MKKTTRKAHSNLTSHVVSTAIEHRTNATTQSWNKLLENWMLSELFVLFFSFRAFKHVPRPSREPISSPKLMYTDKRVKCFLNVIEVHYKYDFHTKKFNKFCIYNDICCCKLWKKLRFFCGSVYNKLILDDKYTSCLRSIRSKYYKIWS
jgi:hypothetical protein